MEMSQGTIEPGGIWLQMCVIQLYSRHILPFPAKVDTSLCGNTIAKVVSIVALHYSSDAEFARDLS